MAEDWKYIKRVIVEDDQVTEYSISFFRQDSGDWYDELRYDSHDRQKSSVVSVISVVKIFARRDDSRR